MTTLTASWFQLLHSLHPLYILRRLHGPDCFTFSTLWTRQPTVFQHLTMLLFNSKVSWIAKIYTASMEQKSFYWPRLPVFLQAQHQNDLWAISFVLTMNICELCCHWRNIVSISGSIGSWPRMKYVQRLFKCIAHWVGNTRKRHRALPGKIRNIFGVIYIIQSSAVITWSNLSWIYSQHCTNSSRTSIRIGTHNRRPIPDLGYLFWVDWGKLPAL